MTPPVSQRAGVVMVQTEPGLQLLAHCIRSAVRESSVRGASTERLRMFHATVMSALTHVAYRTPGFTVGADSATELNSPDGDDFYSVDEAAAELGVTRRQTQRIAARLYGSGGAVRIGRRAWALRKAAVRALKLDREARNGR